MVVAFWMAAGLVGRGVAQLPGGAHQRRPGPSAADLTRALDWGVRPRPDGVHPARKLFGALFEEAIRVGRVTEQLAAALRDPVVRVAHIYEIVAVLVIIFLMVSKPF